MAIFRGTRGNDHFRGTSHNDTFKLRQGGNDTAKGRGGDDSFVFGAAFTKKDVINGGIGNDVLQLNGDYAAGVTFTATTMVNVEKITLAPGHDYKLATHDATVALGQTLIVDGSLLGSANTLTFDGSLETNGHFFVLGGAGDDLMTGGAQGDSFDLTHGGNDTANGGAGDDSFTLGAALTAADQINGGSGSSDVVTLDGDYSTKVTFGATTMVNVEKIVLTAGHGYNLASADATVASGQTLTIDASALGSADFITFDGSAETDGRFTFKGGAGDDTVTIGSVATLLASTIDGGADVASFHDSVVLNGDFSAGASLSAANLTNIETLKFGVGHDYDLTAADDLVPTGGFLDVFATNLGAGDTLSFNGSAETDGTYYLQGGAGNDTLTGGSQSDQFDLTKGGSDIASGGNGNETFFVGGGMDATDQIDGGGGSDNIYMETNAGVNITFAANTLTNVELITCAPHFGGGAFTFVMNDGNVASGATLQINGAILGATPLIGSLETLSVNASAETNGHYTITGGAANDTLIGGALSDTLTGGAGTDSLTGGGGADSLTGGADADSFVLSAASQSSSTTRDTITDLDASADKIDLSVAVSAFDGLVNASVSAASFDANVAAAVNSVIGANEACRLHANAGDLANHDFLVIDANGSGDYEAGSDFVIDITNFTGTITAGLFD
jgi:Ca2+-binding RTX toxin-like protein